MAFMDNNVHDLKLERFYDIGTDRQRAGHAPGRPDQDVHFACGMEILVPYLHDGRLMTSADTVEFFNLVLGLKLSQQEKDDLVAYMLTL